MESNDAHGWGRQPEAAATAGAKAGFMLRAGIATAAIIAGGLATFVTASAHHVISTTPLCAKGGAGATGAAPCSNGPNVAGDTDLLDSANVSASSDRSVKFLLWTPGSCGVAGKSPVFSETDAVGGSPSIHNATITMTGSSPASLAGIYAWQAEILRSNGSVESGPGKCGDEQVNIIKATPAITTDPGGAVAVGGGLSDGASVSGGDDPSGTVTFNLYPPSDPGCTGEPISTWADQSLDGGSAHTASTFKSGEVGVYHWTATYSGDDNNKAVTSACADEAVTVDPASPAISTTPSAGGGTGTSINDSATVTGGDDPAGTVTFNLYGPGDPSCAGPAVHTATVALPGSAPLTVTSDSVVAGTAGTYRWTATFTSNNSLNNGVSSGCGDETVVITAPAHSVQSNVQGITTPSTGSGLEASALLGGLLVLGGAGLTTFAIRVRGTTTNA